MLGSECQWNITNCKGYMFPNDEKEKDRLDIAHEMMLTMLDRELFLAPIGDSPGRVLDLGTGTGIWAIDFGGWCQKVILS